MRIFLTALEAAEAEVRRAIELLQRDLPVHVVAERLGVDRRSVLRWKRTHRRQGRAAPRARPASGRPPKLTAAQRRQLARLVVAGPEAAGYTTSLWTCRRIVDLIRHQFKVVAPKRGDLRRSGHNHVTPARMRRPSSGASAQGPRAMNDVAFRKQFG